MIVGPVREIPTKVEMPEPSEMGRALVQFAILVAIGFGLGVLVLGSFAQLALPRVLQTSVERLRQEPWANMGFGLAAALLIPAVAGLLIATFIGAPTGFVVIAAFIVLMALAVVTAGTAIGFWLRDRRAGAEAMPGVGARIGWTVLGLLILLALSAVPFLGWVFGFLAVLGGLGAVTRGIKDRLSTVTGEPSHALR